MVEKRSQPYTNLGCDLTIKFDLYEWEHFNWTPVGLVIEGQKFLLITSTRPSRDIPSVTRPKGSRLMVLLFAKVGRVKFNRLPY